MLNTGNKSIEKNRSMVFAQSATRIALLLVLSFISLEAAYDGVQAGVIHLRFLYLGSVLFL